MNAIKVGVIGASGYTGLELIKILINHPIFNLNYVANSEGGIKLSSLHPSLKSVYDCDVLKADAKECADSCELVFLAVPHQTAMAFVKPLLSHGIKVVDLSADYRLPLEIYEEFYCPHIDKENLKHAVYGLPELYREEIKRASLIANPGCFPTSAVLATLPFLKYRIENTPIIVDAKTGVSGAGKKLSDTTHFVHVSDNLFAYNPLMHRHAPEMAQKLGISFEELHFVPHLVPLTRGMLSSVFVQIKGDFDPIEVLEEYYKDEPFIRVSKTPVDMKNVAGTNFCDIYVKRKGNMIFVSSAIDNLMRGASSAAVVNANLMMNLAEDIGIPKIAYVP